MPKLEKRRRPKPVVEDSDSDREEVVASSEAESIEEESPEKKRKVTEAEEDSVAGSDGEAISNDDGDTDEEDIISDIEKDDIGSDREEEGQGDIEDMGDIGSDSEEQGEIEEMGDLGSDREEQGEIEEMGDIGSNRKEQGDDEYESDDEKPELNDDSSDDDRVVTNKSKKPEKKRKLKGGDDDRDVKPALKATPSKEDYKGLMAKANKEPNRFKKRMDIARAKKLKQKAKKADQKRKREEAEALGEDAPPKQVPHTLETLREPDETDIQGDSYEMFEIESDEFAPYFAKDYVPKIVITSSHNPNLKTRLFMKELERVIPNSEMFLRRRATVKTMITQSIEKEFTDIIIINEDNKEPSSLLISHLPTGPTCFFRLSNVKLTKHIKRDWREITSHRPEVLTTNFRTRVGLLVARMFGAVFHQEPQFKGRRVVTFHNQRDYIFVRHHRYEFKKEGEKAALRELGPRFTLKLKSVQKGTFDSKTGEYEWIISNKRHSMEKSRRRFYL